MIKRIPSSYVLVEVETLLHDKVLFQDGRELLIDSSYEPEKHNQVSGIVHTAPDSLYFDTSEMEMSMEYDVPMELQKGDKVFFHYLQMSTAIKGNLILTINDKLHIFVRYDQCFCAIRKEEVIMLNGWMLLKPNGEEDMVSSSIIDVDLPTHRRKPHPLKGEVVHLGHPVKKYLWSKHETDENIDVALGDIVMFLPYSDIPLEYALHQSLDDIYYRVQRKDLLNKLN